MVGKIVCTDVPMLPLIAFGGESPTGAVEGRFVVVSDDVTLKSLATGDGEGELVMISGLGLGCIWDVDNPRRDSGVLAGGGLEAPPLNKDVILLLTEWLARMVDMLLDVSEEIVDRGRGMNSRTSDILTRDRSCPFSFGNSTHLAVPAGSCVEDNRLGCEVDLSSTGGNVG